MRSLKEAYARALIEDPEAARRLKALLDLREALYKRDPEMLKQVLPGLEDPALGRAAEALLAGDYAGHLEAEPAFLAAEAWVQKGVEAAFRRALELDEAHPRAWMNLGNLRLEQGDLEGAKAAYDRALALDADLPELHHNLAAYYKRTGNLDAMVRHLKRAQRLRLYPAREGRPGGRAPVWLRFGFWLLLAAIAYLLLQGRGG